MWFVCTRRIQDVVNRMEAKSSRLGAELDASRGKAFILERPADGQQDRLRVWVPKRSPLMSLVHQSHGIY